MIKWFRRYKLKLYQNLGKKLEDYIPEKYYPWVSVLPSNGKDPNGKPLDIVFVRVYIPHNLTKKLIWYLKVWQAC